jgi:hypothetical protein
MVAAVAVDGVCISALRFVGGIEECCIGAVAAVLDGRREPSI